MEPATFWRLIDEARPPLDHGQDKAKRPSASPDKLKAVLSVLPEDEVAAFMRFFYGELIRLNRWTLWGVGYVIAGGMSDDSFHYFRSWLVGKGQDAVDQALRDPDGLGPFVDDPEVDNELLEYVALDLLESRGFEGDPREDMEGSADDEPAGDPFDEDTVSEQFPRLAAQFEE